MISLQPLFSEAKRADTTSEFFAPSGSHKELRFPEIRYLDVIFHADPWRFFCRPQNIQVEIRWWGRDLI